MIKRLFSRLLRNVLLVALEAVVFLFFAAFQLVRMVFQWIRKPRLPQLKPLNAPKLPARKYVLTAGIGMAVLAASSVAYFSGVKNYEEKPVYFAAELKIPAESAGYIGNDSIFRVSLVGMGERLQIHPSWLLAVMFHESRLNPAALNFRGSGATGLIQFMGPALKDINKRLGTQYYLSHIKAMDAVTQLHLVEEYYRMVQERYGSISNFTDAYLAVLYPKAIGKSPDHILFSRPSRSYRQNSGLDINKDGRVTVGDISGRLNRMFPDLSAVEIVMVSE